jgi:hypothetical protein
VFTITIPNDVSFIRFFLFIMVIRLNSPVGRIHLYFQKTNLYATLIFMYIFLISNETFNLAFVVHC